MREIKFRAWDKTNKKWAYIGFHLFGEVTVFNLLSQYKFENACKNLEFMQYTGLTDVNGKEIYEGDILKGTISASGNDELRNGHVFTTKKDIEVLVYIVYDEGNAAFICKCNQSNTFMTRFYRGCGRTKAEKSANEYKQISIPIEIKACLLTMFEVIGNIYENPELLTKTQNI